LNRLLKLSPVVCCGFASLGNKAPRSCALTPPPPQWDGEENPRGKRQKLVGWDEHSLTEWQREKKTTINNTDKKHIQHAALPPPDAQLAPE